MTRIVSLVVIVALIVLLGMTFFQVVAPFLLPLFLAGIVAILCQPLFRRCLHRTGDRRRLAAGLTTAAVMAGVLIPLVVGIVIASAQLRVVARTALDGRQWDQTVERVRAELEIDRLVERLQPYVDEPINPEDLQAELRTRTQQALLVLAQKSLGLAGVAFGLLGTVVAAAVAAALFVIALYYFLADGPALVAGAEALIPVQAEYQRALVARFNAVVRAVVLATFLAAIAQGLATASLLSAFGFHQFFLLMAVATFSALIPVAGTWLVWGPCALWLALLGDWGAALTIALVGVVGIGLLDNLVRTYVLQSDAKLHPLLAFVSVLGGLQVLGLWGVFVGPIVASCLHALVQIFNAEVASLSRERQSAPAGAVSEAASMPPPIATLPAAAHITAASSEPAALTSRSERRRSRAARRKSRAKTQ